MDAASGTVHAVNEDHMASRDLIASSPRLAEEEEEESILLLVVLA